MPESVAPLLRFLDQTRRRHVRWVGLRAISLAAAIWLFGWAFATIAANEGARSAGLLALGIAALGGGIAAWYRGRDLRTWAGARGQAARIEALVPALNGGLLTVVDRAARPQGSAVLLGRLANELQPTVREWPPERVWPQGPVRRDFRWVLLAVALLCGLAVWLPVGPIDAVRSLFSSPVVTTAAASVQADGPRAVLGDVTLRYLYPTYTKLEPLEVPNTNGEVHAPPGTRVEIRARTLEAWKSASMLAYGQASAAELTDGRVVRGSFVVAGEGTWRFESDTLPTADYRIVPDPDLPPTVIAALKPTQSVASDDLMVLAFNAKDDYGMTKVVVEVTLRGEVSIIPLRTPVDSPLALLDSPSVAVTDLGLKSGDVAKLRIGAWDNDEVSGFKPGWSASVEVRVEGAMGRFQERQKLQAELLAALLPLLADFLVDPSPVAKDVPAIRAYGEAADDRYAAFDVLAERAGEAGVEGRVVQSVSERRRELVAFARSLSSASLNPKDAERLATLHAANVESLELAVWTLDQLQRAAASQRLMKLVKELAIEARELQEVLPKLTAPQALARLDQIARLWEQAENQARQLEQGGLRDFLLTRGAELEGAIAATRRDLAKGDDEAAKRDMERVARMLEEMAGGVEEARKRQTGSGDELKKEMEAVRAELEKLADDQSALRSETQSARSKHGQSLDEGMKAWERVDQATAEAERQVRQAESGKAAQASPRVRSPIADAKHDAEGLSDSARARDTETARERADTLQYSIQRAKSRVQAAARNGEIDAQAAAEAMAQLSAADAAAQSAAQGLEQIASSAGQSSPQLQQALKDLSGKQAELAQRGQKAADRASELGQSMPVDSSKMGESAQQGAQEAGRARSELQQGDALGAEGGQQAAEDAFRRAVEALDQAQQDMQRLQQAGEPGGEEGEGGGPGGDDDQGNQAGKRGIEGKKGRYEVKIPAPEEFQTPEEYRRALIEGMQGEVPEAYRAANKRYYEELVRQ